ncbi:hypothetical protein CDD80_5254 [Ophiocordyceps camponoti-rufipedis]|uniref:THO complex subunit 2 n=1 Tax=Ophiocordyceps camponoti-rufipedis TaxID=2004952 RepID=A0A2C5YRR1_9HYPO|nr:hypothetical protein CDD80_5254 [Ophiocordyceps camponoti-rufipedis]
MPLKRKRPERPSGDAARLEPHPSEDADMAYHDEGFSRGGNSGGGGPGGRGRGYRGGYNNRRDSNPGYGRGSSGPPHGQYQSPQAQNQFRNQNQQRQQTRAPTVSVPPQASQPTQAKPPATPSVEAASAVVKQVAEVEQPSLPSPRPYTYDILNDDRLRTWAERGRADVIQHGVQSREDVDITELSNLYQEFIRAVVDGRLEAADAGNCVKVILGDQPSDADASCFLDTLSVMVDDDSQLCRPALRDFLIATAVSPALMREVLDAQLLQQLGLIRDTFARLGVRQATNLLYRQANYNLLREESEGYSKLITEIFITNAMPPPPPERTFERVKALIGTFDLDVGRVLDVTLDVAATVLIKQFKFFVKFLRLSSWWPNSRLDDASPFIGGLPTWATPGYPHWTTSEEDEARNAILRLARDEAFWVRAREVHLLAFFELGGRRIADDDVMQVQASDDDAGANSVQEWISQTQTLPAPGNRVAAQLLGFKLRFYNSPTRAKTDVLPANLLYLVALLIKIGFISLTDLWPHLYPEDDDMERIRKEEIQRQEKLEQETRGGQMNALLLAGALPQGDDDTPTAPAKKELPKKPLLAEQKKTAAAAAQESKKNELPEPLEQKVSLLIQLLTVGAIPESLFILGRFPWIPELYPEVRSRIHRIIHASLEKVYKSTRPKPAAVDLGFCCKNLPDVDQAGRPKGSLRVSPPPAKKTWRWPYPDASDTNENQSYRFYLDEWADNVPVCQTVDDVFTLCGTLVNISGVYIGKDEALLAKLARIGAQSLAEDKSEANLSRWQELMRRLLLPALSQTNANASVVSVLWQLARQFPIAVRYNMYAEWFEGQTSRLPAMKAAFARAASETRATMKRVSLTNLSEMAKRLAKTSYSSPGIVFKVAFEQLEVYSNLIEAFVECAKYFTDLSYDVLVWSLLNSLGKTRSRTQEKHALTTSKWLQALSRFSGKVFRRYPGLDSVPVLEYVNDQLVQGNATDLIILKEFVTSMGGIVDAADFTDYQVMSMAGGSWLRRHTLIRAQDKRLENVKSSRRLIQALVNSGLATRLLIDIAHFRQAAAYRVSEEEAHIKFLSSTIDDSQQTLIQYLDLLWSNLDPASFDAIVPSVPELMDSYGLSTDIAFLIGRASLAHRMYPWRPCKIKKDEASQKSGTDKDGDVKMAESTEADAAEPEAAQQVRGSSPLVDMPTDDDDPQQKSEDPSLKSTAMAALQPVMDSVQAQLGPGVWRKITPEIFAAFWSLQLGDLIFPEEIYVKERQTIMSDWHHVANDRTDMSRRAVDRKIEKRKELVDIQCLMLDELSQHGLRKVKWKFFLSRMFQTNSFPTPAAKTDAISDVLLEHCFLPRVLVAAADAEFTMRFIKALHDWNAPSFRLMSLYDRLFNANRLRVLIYTCTVREAEHLGRFLKLILADLSRWHKNVDDQDKSSNKPSVYDKEAKGSADQPRSGFALIFNDQGKPETFVEHAQFRDMLFRWHKNLNMALKSCLGGTEWMHIRNAITVLNSVLDHFPAVDFMAAQFMAQLQKIARREGAPAGPGSEEGGRVDLAVAAQGAMSELQKRKSKWVMVQAFRSNAAGGQKSDAEKPSTSTRPSPPTRPLPPTRPSSSTKPSPSTRPPTSTRPGLRPTAPDFRPPPRGPKPSGKSGSADEEDGEENQPQRSSETMLRQEEMTSHHSQPSTPRGSGALGNTSDARSHKLPDRPPGHNLPSRPDVPIPRHVAPERYAAPARTGPERRDGREPQAARDGRGEWENSGGRDNGREHREPERTVGRLTNEFPDRRPAADTSADGGLPPRPTQHERERERQYRDPRTGRTMPNRHGHSDSPSHMSGPSNAAGDMTEPGYNSSERPSSYAQNVSLDRSLRGPDTDRQSWTHRHAASDAMDVDGGNERSGTMEDRMDAPQMAPPLSTRTSWREDGQHERGHRAPSPRRSGRYGQQQDHGPMPGSFDDRQGRPYLQDQRGLGRDVRDRSPMATHNTNYRERGDFGDKTRDSSSGFHRSMGRGQEHEHRAPHQDQNYGRLNAGPSVPDVPSGPRGRGRGSGMMRGASYGGSGHSTPTAGVGGGRFGPPETPRVPSPDRLPPTGPAFRGGGRRGGYDPMTGPGTPSSGPGPDRMRSFGNGPGTEMQTATSAGTTTTTPVHPDRLAQMGSSLPQPPPTTTAMTSHSHGRYSNAGERLPPGAMRQAPPQIGVMGPPQSSETGVPTGPASTAANDRLRNGGGRRQLTSINSTLQMSQSMPDLNRGNMRAAQPRQYLGNSDAQVLTGGSPASTPSHERGDVNWHEGAGWGAANGGDGSGRRDRVDRVGRTSRRNSRERERERSPIRGRGETDMTDYRERSNAAKEHDNRRLGRETAPPRNPTGPAPNGGRELLGGREARHGRAGEDWTGGGGYNNRMSGPRGGLRDLRPAEDRMRDERGRKRRSEEGMGTLTSDRDKRPRRN